MLLHLEGLFLLLSTISKSKCELFFQSSVNIREFHPDHWMNVWYEISINIAINIVQLTKNYGENSNYHKRHVRIRKWNEVEEQTERKRLSAIARFHLSMLKYKLFISFPNRNNNSWVDKSELFDWAVKREKNFRLYSSQRQLRAINQKK